MEDEQQLLSVIDVERRTTRGRVCPRCAGKIIPSRRAVYQNSGDPNEVFPAWQCERCGYEELIAKPVKAAPKHGAAAKPAEKKAGTSASPATARSVSTASAKAPAARAAPSMKDSKGRELPPDVVRMLNEMNRSPAEGGKE